MDNYADFLPFVLFLFVVLEYRAMWGPGRTFELANRAVTFGMMALVALNVLTIKQRGTYSRISASPPRVALVMGMRNSVSSSRVGRAILFVGRPVTC